MVNPDTDPVFTHGSLMRHVATMSLTASIGLMAIFAVDLIDMVFISMLGKEALAAAVGYAGTLLFFTNSINIGLSIAAGALVAKAIGAGKNTDAREYATSVVLFAAVTGCVLPFIILPNLEFLLDLLGASGEVAKQAHDYLLIIMPSMVLIGVAMTGMAILRAYGDARRAMYSTLFGGLANAILDPIFIFLFALDLKGAAIASVIARFVILAFAIYPAVRVHHAFGRPSVALLKRDIAQVSMLAGPAVLTNVATPVGAAIMTREMSKFGAEAVAGMAVIGRLTPVAFAVVLALSGAIGPIIGQNFGARLPGRVRKAFTDSLIFIGTFVLAATLLLFLLRAPIADLFEADGVTRTLIYLFCGPLALVYFFHGATFAANAAFNNLGHPLYSTWINWGKNTIGTIPFILAGAAIWGAPGILIGQSIGAIIFAVIAIFLALRVIAAPSKTPVDRPFAKSRRNHVLCHHGRW